MQVRAVSAAAVKTLLGMPVNFSVFFFPGWVRPRDFHFYFIFFLHFLPLFYMALLNLCRLSDNDFGRDNAGSS